MLTIPNHLPILNIFGNGFQGDLPLECSFPSYLCLGSWLNAPLSWVFCGTVNIYSLTKSLLELIKVLFSILFT